jgi:ribosomal-protein-alanine N-acetyltransferase
MLQLNFNPFPTLETARLRLRQIEMSDAENIYNHRLKEKVNTHLENFPHKSIEETKAFIERIQKETAANNTILWVINEKGNDTFIGTVCLWNIDKETGKGETGYTLEPEFHGKGYMTEALEKILDFGFNTIKLKTIEAYTSKNNIGSIKVLTKNNFIIDETQDAINRGTDRIILTLSAKN